MKRIICMCLFAVLTLPTWSLAADIGPARVSYVEGDILFRAPDSDEWLPATVNTPLDEGDSVWCAYESRVEIQLPDGSTVRLDDGSQLDLLANEDGFIHLHLASGYLYLRTSRTSGENSLQIDADGTTVLPAARTRLRLDMLPDNLVDVAVTKGSAYVQGNGRRIELLGGEHILLEEGHSEIQPLNPADSWELWNVERDREQTRSARGDSYLPDELLGHAAELDANGTWVTVPEYGRVWRPAVMVSADWAPYRDGRWIWKGDDYVWLSFEAWGWVPYHFGRWAYAGGYGWCWIPPVRGDVYWGPGYVGWYHTGSYVGWTPLAPGETFYGRRYYGRHSVTITSVNVNTGPVVYRNRANRGGLTVLPQNDFLRGRPPLQQASRTPSASLSVSVGSPRLAPLRETRMPVIRQIPPQAAPPRIERRDNRELRSRFPRVAPETTPQRRRPSSAPAVSVPAAPSGRTPQVREKKTTFPTITPADRAPTRDRLPQQPARQQRDGRFQPPMQPSAPPQPSQPPPAGAQPQQPAPQQRDGNRQGDRPPQAASQPAPTVKQALPPASGRAPQRIEQPQRPATPAGSLNRPPAAPARGNGIQGTPAVVPPVTPQSATPQRVEQPRREAAPGLLQQRKTREVTAPDKDNERDSRGNDNRGRERR